MLGFSKIRSRKEAQRNLDNLLTNYLKWCRQNQRETDKEIRRNYLTSHEFYAKEIL